jgi:hypothetical protein
MAFFGDLGWYDLFVDSIEGKEGGIYELVSRSLDRFDDDTTGIVRDARALADRVIESADTFSLYP